MDRVELRFGDMRTAERPAREEDRADIVVSELLGSFGDNELSPECLDGACRFLKTTGVSIPASYSSFITPLSSAKLHNEILSSGNSAGVSSNTPCASTPSQVKSAETPFVVLFGQVNLPASDTNPAHEKIQQCWRFDHGPVEGSNLPLDPVGLPLSNSHNVRTTSHTFVIPTTTVCHGLAGYFEAHLYDDVVMSIHPDPSRGSPDMLSWFPMFFPLKEPLYVPAGAELDVHLWRLTSGRKMWYEWSVEVFLNISVPAVGGVGGSTSRPASTQLGQDGGAGQGLGLNLGAGSTDSAPPQIHLNGANPSSASTHSSSTAAGAFTNATHTPRIPSLRLEEEGSGSPQMRQVSGGSAPGVVAGGRSFSQASAGANSILSQPGSGNKRMSTSSATNQAQSREQPQRVERIKVAMSSLQNPNGRSHWVGM